MHFCESVSERPEGSLGGVGRGFTSEEECREEAPYRAGRIDGDAVSASYRLRDRLALSHSHGRPYSWRNLAVH